jgi:hypothetical protein
LCCSETEAGQSQVVRWNVHMLGLAWYRFVVHAYYALTFCFGGNSVKCSVLQRRKGKLLNSCSDCLVSFHSVFSLPSDGLMSPHHHRSGKNKKPFGENVILYFVLSFKQEPLLYPNITHFVEPNTNIVWIKRQHFCVTFCKCHIHILVQRPDVLTNGLIIFLSFSRHVPK